MPIHFIVSHSFIRHRTQLLMSIHSHLNTPYPLSSFMLSRFYSSIHFLLSLIPSSLTTLLPSHSSSHHSSHSFLSTSSSLSHSILIPSFILFHFNATVLSSSSSLFYIQLLDSILSFYCPLCSQTPFYYHSPHTSIFHSFLPYLFTQHLFNSFSSLLSFHSHSIELEIVIFGRRTSL